LEERSKINLKETKIISCKVSTSISSLISNITGYARYFLSSKFPPDFFKKVYISESLAELQMEDSNIVRFSKPTLIITPQYTGETGFMELLPRWHTTHQFTFKNPRKKYNGVLYDSENDIYIYSIPDRIKLNFDVRIKLASPMQAYNVLHYIKQSFEIGGYFYLNQVRLQTELPKMYTRYIANRLGYDLNTADGREKLDEYLLQHSYNGIMEKINLSSGNSQYAYNYKSNILVNFPDLPTYEKNNSGMVVDNTTVSFSFSFELWSHSNYVMEIKEIKPDLEFPIDLGEGETMKYDFYIPDTHFIKQQVDNMHMIINKPFLPDINEEVDILDFKPIINSELKEVIDESLKNRFDMSKLLKVMVLVDNKELDDLMFEVDWKNLVLKTHKPMSNLTYTLVLYGDLKKLNLISKYIMDGKRKEIASLGF
jgi:hypothetical protein